MTHIRPFIFFAFVGLFFITAFAVVFYAFGYRFNLERGIFVYTGSISIKSSPETVDVRIDDEPVSRKNLGILNNSILISGLAPGEHFIEVSAPGYLPWSKKALVESGLSTEFWNVLLAEKHATLQDIPSVDSVKKVFPAPDQNLLAVAGEKNGELLVDTLDTATGESERVFSLPEASLAPDGENIEWSPDNRKLIIPFEQDGARLYSIITREDGRVVPLQQLARHERTLHNPRWDSTARDIIFYLDGTTLYRADSEASDEDMPLAIRDNVLAYDISGSDIYYLGSDTGIVYRISGNSPGTAPAQITTAPIDADPQALYSIIVYDDARLAVREHATGKLWAYSRLSAAETVLRPLADSGTKGIQFSNDGKKLLFFTDNEISAYFVRDWETQPIREQDTAIQVARFSTTIRNVQWTEDYEHILFTLNGSAKIIELDSRDRRNMAEIVAFPAPISQALSRFGENRVYFVSETGALSYIPFPSAPTTLFGF